MNSLSFPLSERPVADKATFVAVEPSELEAVNGGMGMAAVVIPPPHLAPPPPPPGWCGTVPHVFH
jgi:hypothetical protein